MEVEESLLSVSELEELRLRQAKLDSTLLKGSLQKGLFQKSKETQYL